MTDAPRLTAYLQRQLEGIVTVNPMISTLNKDDKGPVQESGMESKHETSKCTLPIQGAPWP